jgi:hypothetical protein
LPEVNVRLVAAVQMAANCVGTAAVNAAGEVRVAASIRFCRGRD